MWQKRLIDLTAGEIVKVVGTAEHGMCYVNKPGKCPVLAPMELVDTEWLQPVNRNFKECDYCGAIDHATSGCPYQGKIPYGCKGISRGTSKMARWSLTNAAQADAQGR